MVILPVTQSSPSPSLLRRLPSTCVFKRTLIQFSNSKETTIHLCFQKNSHTVFKLKGDYHPPVFSKELSYSFQTQRINVNFTLTCAVQFQFKMVSISLGKPIYALHPIFHKFLQRCLSNSSNVFLIDNGPFLSFQWRLSSTYSFNASLLQVINSVMSLALCPQLVVSQAPQHVRSS